MTTNKRKVFLISMVKNEADIIESFIRYHQYIFDGMVILDNNSTDNTVPILEKLITEGFSLELIRDKSMEFIKGKKTTDLLYSTFKKYNPDIIFLLDADEFLICNNGNPRDIINVLDLNKVYYLNRFNYIPDTSDNHQELFIPKRIVNTTGDINSPKVFFTRTIVEKYAPNIRQGNHDILSGIKVEREKLKNLFIAHFPIRSIEQAKLKTAIGWVNNLARHDRVNGQSTHWQKWFNIMKDKQDIKLNDFFKNIKYSRKPINLSFCKSIKIQYTMPNEVNFMKNFLGYCEMLGMEHGKIRKDLIELKNRENGFK
ncbi:glycosyltransferase family 2 protein [Alkalihalobacterium elongatum]|uniref:glycosyltransferase family 2 protein n=1 Tax=Alkalihalobacterium elongatum TaxID=2675466 RepID=UPI001C1FE3B6|nr:glycosyltransferase family 2 protein [Alkalihalobacterium elongatum]